MKKSNIYIFITLFSLVFSAYNILKADLYKIFATQNLETMNNSELNKSISKQKAVTLAEEFIARNGYTKEPADRENITYESISFAKEIDELLESRHDSLEPKAYGYLNKGKDGKGWTVVFRFSESSRHQDKKDEITDFIGLGRVVTMDTNFGNLRVGHKDFILKFAKKLDSSK